MLGNLPPKTSPSLKVMEPEELKTLVKAARFAGPRKVAVSISRSHDFFEHELPSYYQRMLIDEIHRYLLLAGHVVAYGGALEVKTDNEDNFTKTLFDLAETVAEDGLKPILYVPPWPLYLGYGSAEERLLGKVAKLERGPEPDLPWKFDDIFPPVEKVWRFLPKIPEQRYAWARGLSEMREMITDKTDAKVVIGGNLRKFLGIVPGVVEESWWSLVNGKPLYLIGAFGGCARAVSDQLIGLERPEFSVADARENVPDYDAAVACYDKHGGNFISIETMGRGIAERGKSGLAAALNNGLSEDANAELIRCTDPLRIAELVLTGLTNL